MPHLDRREIAAIFLGGMAGSLLRVWLARTFSTGVARLAVGDVRDQRQRLVRAGVRRHAPAARARAVVPRRRCSASASAARTRRSRRCRSRSLQMVDHERYGAGRRLRAVERARRLSGDLSPARRSMRRGVGGAHERVDMARRGAARRRRRVRALRGRRRWSRRCTGGNLPLGVLAVNVSGSLLLGLLVGLAPAATCCVLAGAATLGSYTTFSTWMFETQRLAEGARGRAAVANVLVSLLLGVGAVALGRAIGAWLFEPSAERDSPSETRLRLKLQALQTDAL